MKTLLSGANGYIGRHLLPILVEKGYSACCLVRDHRRLVPEEELSGKIHIYEAGFLNGNIPDNLPKDIDAAYYLIHSMGRSYRHKIRETSCRNEITGRSLAEIPDQRRKRAKPPYSNSYLQAPGPLPFHKWVFKGMARNIVNYEPKPSAGYV